VNEAALAREVGGVVYADAEVFAYWDVGVRGANLDGLWLAAELKLRLGAGL
jgi:hypothetical protein